MNPAHLPSPAPAGTQGDLVARMAEILSDAKARQHPDAELLAVFSEANRLRDYMDGPDLGDEDVPDHISQRYAELVRQIAALPARTAEGVTAKLMTFTHEIQGAVYSYKGPNEQVGLFPMFIRTALEGAQRIGGAK